jgi:hypothetical protein
MRALPAKRRLIVFLRYFADLSYAEIAQICDPEPRRLPDQQPGLQRRRA